MEEGNLHEPDILRRISEELRIEIYNEQREVEYDSGNGWKIRGHIDGETDQYVVEAKARSRAAFLRWQQEGFEAFQSSAPQISFYMRQLQKPALYLVKSRDSGVINVQVLDQPPISFEEIVRKVERIEQMALSATQPSEVVCDLDQVWFCRYLSLHDRTHPDADTGQAPDLGGRAAEMAQRLLKVKQANRVNEAEMEELQAWLNQAMGTLQTAQAGRVFLTRRSVSRTTLDRSLVRKALGDLSPYQKTSTHQQLIVEER